jgi:hypothetical protein
MSTVQINPFKTRPPPQYSSVNVLSRSAVVMGPLKMFFFSSQSRWRRHWLVQSRSLTLFGTLWNNCTQYFLNPKTVAILKWTFLAIFEVHNPIDGCAWWPSVAAAVLGLFLYEWCNVIARHGSRDQYQTAGHCISVYRSFLLSPTLLSSTCHFSSGFETKAIETNRTEVEVVTGLEEAQSCVAVNLIVPVLLSIFKQ